MDLYQIFSSCSLCDIILNYKISAHLHNICMDFPQFQSAKWDIYEEHYSEKTNYSKHMFSSVTCRDLARNEEFSEIAVINIFFTVIKTKTQLSVCGGGGGVLRENFEISHAIDM